ncbi:MAG: hypothetical protein U0T85_02730 [Cloacibacterium normanense]
MPYKKFEGIENIDKIVDVDQTPIGRTPRSNPATYTGMFTDIRNLFAELPESKIRGYKAGRFSFNVKGGRCETSRWWFKSHRNELSARCLRALRNL